jgi:hypothetical protein
MALLCLGLSGCAGLAAAPADDPGYPRYDAERLAADGYPDPHHAYFRADWRPRLDAAGESFGYGTLCDGLRWLDRPDAVRGEGRLELGPITLDYHPDYDVCAIAPFVAFCEAALYDLGELWGLRPRGVLALTNPDNVEAYQATTGQGTWRTFLLTGDTAIVQPVPVLLARTLAPHTAYDLVGRWLLQSNTGDALPRWLLDGLCAYGADLGVHLNNYMAQFRVAGEVLLTPADVEKLLAAGVIPNDDLDRQMFRRARYSAFLMAWRLVEERGGPGRVRALLARVAGGEALDAACRAVYGVGGDELAASLDPTALGEPIGAAVQARNPQLNPGPQGLPHRSEDGDSR